MDAGVPVPLIRQKGNVYSYCTIQFPLGHSSTQVARKKERDIAEAGKPYYEILYM